jgi:hypothetical protein
MQGSTALGPPHERASDEARKRVIAPVNDSFTNVLFGLISLCIISITDKKYSNQHNNASFSYASLVSQQEN